MNNPTDDPGTRPTRDNMWSGRIKPFVAGASSAAVVMFAFLIPSMQDLLDRRATRHAVDQYADIGRALLLQGKYTAAEDAFGRALDLGGGQRFDLLELKLKSRVQRVLEGPEWQGDVPEDVTESDFLYLVEVERESAKPADRALILAAYAQFLARQGRLLEAEDRVREAISLAPGSAEAQTSLGNIAADLGKNPAAEAAYRRALQLDETRSGAHYDLGLLLAEKGDHATAIGEFKRYTELEPRQPQGFLQLAEQMQAAGRLTEARAAYQAVLQLEPGNLSATRGLQALQGK